MAAAGLLLVNSEVPFTEITTKHLSTKGFRISTAPCGMTALEILKEKQNSIEIMLLSIEKQGMDGIGILEEIKRKYPLVEVIMLADPSSIGIAVEGMKKGAFDFMIKPFDIELFIPMVIKAVAKRQEHRQKIIQARMKEITLKRQGLNLV